MYCIGDIVRVATCGSIGTVVSIVDPESREPLFLVHDTGFLMTMKQEGLDPIPVKSFGHKPYDIRVEREI